MWVKIGMWEYEMVIVEGMVMIRNADVNKFVIVVSVFNIKEE